MASQPFIADWIVRILEFGIAANIGTPIGSYDLQIAAIALSNDLLIVTHNTREFERIDGLKLEDWEAEQ